MILTNICHDLVFLGEPTSPFWTGWWDDVHSGGSSGWRATAWDGRELPNTLLPDLGRILTE